jgi:membrane protease YdiL (CAAX protease family)
MRMSFSPVSACVIGLSIFLLTKLAAIGVGQLGLFDAKLWNLYGFKTMLLLVSVGLIFTSVAAQQGRSLAEYGVRRSAAGTRRVSVAACALAIPMGALGPLSGLVLPGSGMGPLMEQFPGGFIHVLLGVWLWSSFTEEVFVRGLIQSWMDAHTERGIQIRRLFVSTPVLVSGLLFGAFHLTILFAGCDLPTTLRVFVMTAAGGILCAWLRERTQSILPAIVCHVFLNIGSMVGGIIGMLLRSATPA